MNVHEHQAKEVLANYGLPVPPGIAAFSVEEAKAAAQKLGGSMWVVKSQIHAGGRGKGKFKELPPEAKGGVRLAFNLDEVASHAKDMLGNTLVTVQTGAAGKQVQRLYIAGGADIARELYLSVLVDRGTGRVAFVASEAGGMDIETVAHDTPEKISTIVIDPAVGVTPADSAKVAKALNLEAGQADACHDLCVKLYTAFTKGDMEMCEINPLIVEEGTGKLVCLDAKMSFDSNAEFRHPEWAAMRDLSEEDDKEIEASKYDLAYIALDGTIGCMVNGAGLAMATMDIIKLYGEEPANFLDVGGGAKVDQVTKAFQIILSDKNVKAVLVNIFGGIMKCDTIVEALLGAYEKVGFNVPLVVRLEGTNVELAREMLAKSGRPIISATDLTDAAKKVVASLKA